MTDTKWILHGPGKHDRAVCDTAETWCQLFTFVAEGQASFTRVRYIQKNIGTLRRLVDSGEAPPHLRAFLVGWDTADV